MVGISPRVLPATAVALCVAGLAVSGYLTYEHFTTSSTLACPQTGTFDCRQVTTSAQSKLLGIPVAVLGVAYFAGMLLLVALGAVRAGDRRITALRLAGAAGGVVFVLYLVYAELFIIDKICMWCTVVHAVTVALFAVIALGAALTEPS